jgi:diguanylate cyclase (GGDEF)-like protein
MVTAITKNEFTDVINNQQLAFSKFIANDINEEIRKALAFVAMFADNIPRDIVKNPSNFDSWLADAPKLPPVFNNGVVLISSDGKKMLAEYPIVPGRKHLSFDHSEWFARAISEKKSIYSKAFLNRVNHAPIIVFAAPIKNDQNNEVLAIVAASMDLTHPEVFKSIYNLQIGESGGVLVISPEDKLFIASNVPEMILKPTPLPGRNKLHDKAMKGYRGVGVTANAYGVEELVAITNIDTTGWFVVIRLPVDEAYRPMRKISKALLIYLSLLAIAVISIIVGILITLLSPLKKSAASVRQMALRGHPLDKFPVDYNNEVGDLLEGVNRLIDTVNAKTNHLEKTKAKLEQLSMEDPLTKVFNRRTFDAHLHHSWREHMRSGLPLSIIMMDIDYFKLFNDTYDHLEGDNCLITISNCFKECLRRPNDFLARYGGEEFVVVVDSDLVGAEQLALLLRNAITDLDIVHEASPIGIVTISLGVSSVIPTKDYSAKQLIGEADKALYKSKINGRNRVSVYVDID